MRGGSLRVRGTSSRPYPSEHESLLAPHPSLPHPSHPHLAHLPPPLLLSRRYPHRRDRRALSLELPQLLLMPASSGSPLSQQYPQQQTHLPLPLKKTSSREKAAGEHQDCNGKAPAGPLAPLLGEVFPQVNSRKGELEEEVDYVSEERCMSVECCDIPVCP